MINDRYPSFFVIALSHVCSHAELYFVCHVGRRCAYATCGLIVSCLLSLAYCAYCLLPLIVKSDALRLSDLRGLDGATEPATFIPFPLSFILYPFS